MTKFVCLNITINAVRDRSLPPPVHIKKDGSNVFPSKTIIKI